MQAYYNISDETVIYKKAWLVCGAVRGFTEVN